MTLTQKRLLILLVIAVVAFVLGRLAVRAVMNLGTVHTKGIAL